MRNAAQKASEEEILFAEDIPPRPKPTLVRRLPALDGLRGLAVIEVFLYHARTPPKNSGWIGVELFLALSGFVITRSLLGEWRQTGKISVWDFIKRRVARIYPALIFLLVGYAGIASLIYRKSYTKIFSEIIPSFFGFANWSRALGSTLPREMGHLWSLSVELQLYLIWAPLVILLLKKSSKSLVGGILFLATGCLFYRYLLVYNEISGTFIYNNTICRALPFIFGSAAAAFVANQYAQSKFENILKVIGTILFIAALLYHFYELRYCSLPHWSRRNWNPLLVSLSAAIIVWGISERIIPALSNLFSLRPLYYLGSISYGAFLWHYPVLLLFPRAYADYRFIGAAALSLLLGSLSFELVEKRFLTLNVAPK